MCFFQAQAVHNGCHPKNLECDAKHHYKRYRKTLFDKKFSDVKVKELPDLKHLVYALEPAKCNEEEEGDEEEMEDKPKIAAQLVHRSLCHYPSTLYLNLYQHHFSYIKDMNQYGKSYCCSRGGKF